MRQLPVKIKSLWTNIPADSNFVSGFVNFTDITELGIRSYGNYPLRILNNTFETMSHLPIRNLTISSGRLTDVEPLAFSWFNQLEYLDLSNCTGRLSVADLYPAWYGLQFTQLKWLILSRFSQDGRRPVALNYTFFEDLDFKHLTELKLDHTNIESATTWKFSKHLMELERLSLAYNYLNISQVRKLTNNDVKYLANLNFLDMSFQSPRKASDIPNSIKFTVFLSPNLKTLKMPGSAIWPSYQIHYVTLSLIGSNKLEVLNLHSNAIDFVQKPCTFVEQPNNLTTLAIDFSSNKLTTMEFLQDSIAKGLRLRMMKLNENKLGNELSRPDSLKLFATLPELEILDLSTNEVKKIWSGIFRKQSKMKRLNLSKNFLGIIEFEFSHMTNLLSLDLSGNLITRLDASTCDKLDMLKSNSPRLRMSLQDNPLECSCQSLTFMRWMNDRQNMLRSFQTYTCIYNNTATKFDKFQSILNDLEYQCSLNLAAKISAGLLSLVIIVTGISIVLYQHRWDVRFFCIKFVAKSNAYTELVSCQEMFEFDAFVAYHKSDLQWVLHELFENLDLEGGRMKESNIAGRRYKLCIHDRDFIPGSSIEDNIVRAIETSRKTILVLSKNFVTSGWCEFELQMARMESFNKGRNLIIAVMLEPLEIEKISKSLKLLIRRHTYIEWFGNSENTNNFWEKMRIALGAEEDF